MSKNILARPIGAVRLLLLATLSLISLRGFGQSVTLAQWALTSNNAPTYSVMGVSAGNATLKRLVTPASTNTPPDYSGTYGQAVAPSADGLWTTPTGTPAGVGPGGTLSRKYYEQFTVTGSPTTAMRLDSLVLTEAYYATASNAKLAIVYSKTGFTTADSTEFSGGGTNNGAAVTYASTGLGNFTRGANMLQNNAGPTNPINTYRLPLNGTAGVTLAAGQTLTIRLYNSCGSGSAGKYVMLKGFTVKGQVISIGTVTTTTAQLSFATPPAGGYTYTIATNPTGGTATQATAPVAGNNYLATYTISGLASNTAYTATVTATPSGSPAGPTLQVAATTSTSFTTANATCPSVSGLTVGSITQTGASVSFTPGSGNNSFVVTYTPSGGSTTTISPNPTTSPVTLAGLTGGTSYTVTVQGVCASGAGTAQSATFSTLTCADPSGLAFTNVTSTSANLAFTPGSGNSSYAVTYYPTGSPGAAQAVSPAPTASPVPLSGLTPGTNYTVTLQSTCSNGAVGNVLTRTFTTRLASSPVLQQWPLTSSASDDATTRSPGVTASTATLSNLVVANGSVDDGESAGNLPGYSSLGQGIAPTVAGTGWTGTVTLTRYEEFTVTAAPGGSVRVDSLVFSAGGYGSTMNVSVAYSLDGFASAGTFIAGSQATPVALNKVSSTGYSLLRLPLTGPAGVTLAAGGTVAFRLYYALGSSSARHALTKNLYVTGVATPTCPSATAVSISNITQTKAQLNFTPGTGNPAYAVTVTPQGGSTTTISPAPTASPVALTGLNAATTYTVTLQTNCGGIAGYVQSLTFTTPVAKSSAIQQWPLVASNADNAAVRSYAVVASTPTLNGLTSSTNTISSSPPVPAYSATYGQAFSPATSGDGSGWSSSASLAVYEEFTLTASAGNNLRADTLVFSSALYNSANGKIAVAYSTDGFATAGTFLLGTIAAPATLNNYNNLGFSTYRLALGNLTRTSGQVLSFRLYYAAATGSAGRYALLRNVYVAGEGFVNNLPNLTIGDTQTVPTGTTYGNITVVSGGVATLNAPVVAQGSTTVQSGGVLNTNCQALTGGTFTLAAGGELQICDPAGISASGSTGAVQVAGTRSFSPDAIYTYTGAYTSGANQATGSGLPTAVRTLNVNMATATDSLQLGSNLTVGNSLNLVRGILKTYTPTRSSSFVVTMNSGNTTISETSSSFVIGQVQSATLFFGSDGSNSTFGGLGMRLVAHTATNLPGNTYVLRSTGTPVYGAGSSASIRRQYRIVPVNETGLNVDMTFSYLPNAAELNNISPANLRLFSRPIAGGVWTNEQGTNAGNTVAKTALTHLSDWTLGNAAAPLPVTLSSFSATRQAANALLTWATASELNSSGFEVQVATAAGADFRRLGFVAGAGSSQTAHSYQFLDTETNKQGARYYRLKLIDQDGSAAYSPTQVVQFESGLNANALQVSPNPFHGDALTLTTFSTAPTTTATALRLTDALGRTVRTQVLDVPTGTAQLSFSGLEGLPAGLYILQATINGQPQRLKLVRN